VKPVPVPVLALEQTTLQKLINNPRVDAATKVEAHIRLVKVTAEIKERMDAARAAAAKPKPPTPEELAQFAEALAQQAADVKAQKERDRKYQEERTADLIVAAAAGDRPTYSHLYHIFQVSGWDIPEHRFVDRTPSLDEQVAAKEAQLQDQEAARETLRRNMEHMAKHPQQTRSSRTLIHGASENSEWITWER
jgi:acetolactate synthase small subunit